MTDLSSPSLIGLMVAIAVDGVTVKSIPPLVDSGCVSPQEAREMTEALKNSLIFARSILSAMDDEFVFFKHCYAVIYERAPLAMWMLEMIHGNPIPQYKKLVHETFEIGSGPIEISFPTNHPLLAIAFPNFRKAKTVYLEKLTQKSLLAAELGELSGQPASFPDPFSEQPLKSLKRDGKTVFYSVGPDKTDDQGKNDDLVLPRKDEK